MEPGVGLKSKYLGYQEPGVGLKSKYLGYQEPGVELILDTRTLEYD